MKCKKPVHKNPAMKYIGERSCGRLDWVGFTQNYVLLLQNYVFAYIFLFAIFSSRPSH